MPIGALVPMDVVSEEFMDCEELQLEVPGTVASVCAQSLDGEELQLEL